MSQEKLSNDQVQDLKKYITCTVACATSFVVVIVTIVGGDVELTLRADQAHGLFIGAGISFLVSVITFFMAIYNYGADDNAEKQPDESKSDSESVPNGSA